MRVYMQIFVCVGFLLIYLVCKRTICLLSDKDIKEWKVVILLDLHSELDVIRLVV
jgi:hypothetical protein